MSDRAIEVEAARGDLMRLAFRMLGTVADAEDAVQEASVRWLRLTPDERAAIENPAAWLTTATSRICLDALTSARARRERYVGEWLPEPVPGDADLVSAGSASAATDPLDRVSLDESVSTALLVVLESLTPPERVAFVLHDVFGLPFDEIAETVGRSPVAVRQLASQARRHVHDRRPRRVDRAEHDAAAGAFAAACATGDLGALVGILDPDVVLRADGGGLRSSARRPVLGADRVARFLLGLPRLVPGATMEPVTTADGLGFLVRVDGVPDSVFTVAVAGGRITDVWIVRNPEKLRLWI
jgi:RNA polymerase sigma-70 factor (ECF subfamily)